MTWVRVAPSERFVQSKMKTPELFLIQLLAAAMLDKRRTTVSANDTIATLYRCWRMVPVDLHTNAASACRTWRERSNVSCKTNTKQASIVDETRMAAPLCNDMNRDSVTRSVWTGSVFFLLWMYLESDVPVTCHESRYYLPMPIKLKNSVRNRRMTARKLERDYTPKSIFLVLPRKPSH